MTFNYNEYIFYYPYDSVIPRYQRTNLSVESVYSWFSAGFVKFHICIVTICLCNVWLTLLMHFLLVACQAYYKEALYIT